MITVVTEALANSVHIDRDWQSVLRDASISTAALLGRLGLEAHIDGCDLEPEFRCLATESYIEKITPGDIHDPLLRQILPMKTESDELIQAAGLYDPVGDIDASATTGLLHKYHGRALMITTAACAIHCRYCFRRNFPYQQSSLTTERIGQALAYIRNDPDIEEVILSGGDPLVLSNDRLARLIERIETLPRVNTLRIHSRLPVVLPERIDGALLDMLTGTRLEVVMVIHCNHANELRQAEQGVLESLSDAGVTLLNQSVLLNGVNDNTDTLVSLSRRLFACRTLPYYLHMLDPTHGAMHFAVDDKDALAIHRQMQARLPGYLVPRLVREIPGKDSKTAISRI